MNVTSVSIAQFGRGIREAEIKTKALHYEV